MWSYLFSSLLYSIDSANPILANPVVVNLAFASLVFVNLAFASSVFVNPAFVNLVFSGPKHEVRLDMVVVHGRVMGDNFQPWVVEQAQVVHS